MSKIISFEEFSARVEKVTNGRISVVKETFTGMRNKVIAYCNVHKIYFEVYRAYDLTKLKIDCPECSEERKRKRDEALIIPFEKVLKQFIKSYGDKFSYDKSSYHGRKKLMKVHCNDCNTDFEITPEHHLKYNNGGCPNCHKFKTLKCFICGKDILVDRHCKDDLKIICDECKKEQKTLRILKKCKRKTTINDVKYIKCPFCGLFHKLNEKCENELCNRFYSINNLKKLIPFGFDFSSIGSLRYIEEFNKAVKVLLTEYFNNNLTVLRIFEKYNCREYFDSVDTINHLLKNKLILDVKNFTNHQHETLKNGTYLSVHSLFKFEHHTSWDAKTFLLRSSYESDFANILDELKIVYEVEHFRIRYYDTYELKERIAVPDFYLPDTNTIVEVKSSWTLNKQNMIDKRDAYLKLGYNFKLWYEHEYVELDDISNIEHNLDFYKRNNDSD